MTQKSHPVEAALRSGSRAKNYARQIAELCRGLPECGAALSERQRAAASKLAVLCRAAKAVNVALGVSESPAIDGVAEFSDLFCDTYYPVLEDGKRIVAFWSIKDKATLSPADVHEWVRDRKVNKKTEKSEVVAVPFGSWWTAHRPDYDLYGVAADRAMWQSKVIDADGRKCVNTVYGMPPVLAEKPARYGDGAAASALLDELLNRTITDPDPENALRKRQNFVLDAGAHLLALRDGGNFRCRKIFCFASTNRGQGTGKSVLHESIAALVPRDAAIVVPTTTLATENLLPLYSASVCILTEAPSTATEKYTAEDVKAFADAGWKNAQEKYVAKRAVRDNSVKLMSSNHLSPLPIDSARSRRIEFFVSLEVGDGGESLRRILDEAEARHGWTVDDLRACVGWALLERAARYLEEGAVPFAVARRTIAAKHLLSPADLDFFETNPNATEKSHSDYRDFRSDKGITWAPDYYRFCAIVEMASSVEGWIDDAPVSPRPPTQPEPPKEEPITVSSADGNREGEAEETEEVEEETTQGPIALQYKRRMATAYLEESRIGIAALYAYIVGDAGLKASTEAVRAGTANKKEVLRQVFPGAWFKRFSREANIVGWTGLTHVDFDHVKENGNGITPEQIRDALAELPGFVIGGLSSRANGAWGIFNAGDGIKDYDTYMAAERSLFAMCEERMCMKCDEGPRLPTVGRTLAYDEDCRICDEAIAGGLPASYPWKAPTFAVSRVRLRPSEQRPVSTADEAVRNERFMERVVENSCEKIQQACEGERHDAAIKAIANIDINARERGVAPLSTWGRRIRDACQSVGLEGGEVNSIMTYWKQRTGLAG